MTSASLADIVGWDVRTWSRAIEAWELALATMPDGPLDVLEVGAGPAGPSLWLALQGHRVVTSNLGETERLARPLHERYGVMDRIEYRDLDLTTGLPYAEAFDVIVFKSVLGGLGSADPALPAAALDAIHAALRPGGMVLWAENLRGSWLHRGARAVAYRIRRARRWQYLTLRRLRELLETRFSDVDVHVGGVLAVLGSSEGARDRLARADQAVIDRIVPASWHYMAYGSARKQRAD
jgi:SAM-dependent methyltransferase